MEKKIKCPECRNLMDFRAKRCRSCHNKQRQNLVFCKDCGKKLDDNRAIRCRKCWEKTNPIKNEKNPNWNNNVGIDGVHSWVRRRKNKPKLCELCHEVPPLDLANISQEYKRDASDFKWVCRKCHMNEDGRLDILRKMCKGVSKKDVI